MVMRRSFGRLTLLSLTGFVVALACLVPSHAAADHLSRTQTLKGLRGVTVFVEGLTPEAEREGLTKLALQTDIELKLRQAGIRVLTTTEWDTAALFVKVNLVRVRAQLGLYAVSISVQVVQGVYLARDPMPIVAATWEATETVGVVGASNVGALRSTVGDHVNEFINAYLSVNPKN